MEPEIIIRLEKLERRNYKLKLSFYFLVFLFLTILLHGFSIKNNEIIRAKGIIINDSLNRPRIVIGAPAPMVNGRIRTDDLVGLAYIDEKGADRITLGKEPNPITGEGIKVRRIGATGLVINDENGIERGAYGVLDDDMAILTLDWPKNGEAISLGAGNAFAGIGLFHRSKPGVYREALTLGVIPKENQSFIKITDTNNTQRVRIETLNSKSPQLKIYNETGKEIENKTISGN